MSDPSLLKMLYEIGMASPLMLIILTLGWFARNRALRVDELQDKRVDDAQQFASSLAEIEKDTVRALDNIEKLILSRNNGGSNVG